MFSTKNMIVWLSVILFSITPANAKETLRIVAVTSDFAAIAKGIGGKHVQVHTLVPGSYNLHYVYPKPSMVNHVTKADILIRLGMGQDTWVEGLMDVASNTRILKGATGYIDASRDIVPLEVPTGSVDRRHGDVHIHGNPHYWLDPNNGKVIANHLLQQLRILDPSNATFYTRRYQVFCALIDKKMPEWQASLKAFSGTGFIAYHKVWSYFYKAFNLTSIGYLEPFPGISPTVPHLLKLSKVVTSESKAVRVIGASYYPEPIVKRFANSIASPYTILPTSLEGDMTSYTDLFDHIIFKLTK